MMSNGQLRLYAPEDYAKGNGYFGRAGWHVLSKHQTLNQERNGLIKVETKFISMVYQ